jgi:hypothetical protein
MSTAIIRKLNDICRQAWGVYPNTRYVFTQGIQSLTEAERSEVREKVESYTDFSPDNDPHQEHDFGAFEVNGQKVFWKIDTYAPDLMHGSENPSDPRKTVRVLTVMLASEY